MDLEIEDIKRYKTYSEMILQIASMSYIGWFIPWNLIGSLNPTLVKSMVESYISVGLLEGYPYHTGMDQN